MASIDELLAGMAKEQQDREAFAKANPDNVIASLMASAGQVNNTLARASESPEELGKALEIISPTGLGTIAGKASKLWDKAGAELAEKMFDAGASLEQIWRKTGTYIGPLDERLRQEISDIGASLKPAVKEGSGVPIRTLGDVLEHKKLFEAYPELADIPVEAGKGFAFGKNVEGQAGMRVDPTILKENPQQFLSSTLHEVQHGVQNIEGFTKGGNLTSAMNTPAFKREAEELEQLFIPDVVTKQKLINRLAINVYRRIGGEAEARAVQARQHLDPADARNILPTESYDISLGQLIKAPK